MEEDIRFVATGEVIKTYDQPDGSVIVEGRLGGPTLDLDGQRLDKTWLDTAVPEWSKIGNIRAMHQPVAAGKAQSVTDRGDDWHVVAKIVDPVEAMKCRAGLYTGFSVGIKGGGWVTKNNEDWINRGKIIELSLADYPCDPANTVGFTVSKVALGEVTDEELEKLSDPEITKRDFTAADRKRMASEGKALPDGSFPIANEEDLHNAVRLAGHAKDKAEAKKHIIARAQAMGLSSALPEDWTGDAQKFAFEDLVVKAAANPEYLELLRKIVAPEVTKSAPSCACCHACTGGEGCPCTCPECVWNKGDASMVTPPSTEKADVDENATPTAVAPPANSPDGAVDKVVAPDVDMTKFVTADALKAALAETMKASLAEALSPLEARLVEMEKRAAPGGPAVVKRQFDGPEAIQKALLQKRADAMQGLLNHPDPRIAQDARQALTSLGL